MVVEPLDLLALRLEAMCSVYAEDPQMVLRSICRWYSQRFATPLHLVGSAEGVVDIHEVLRTFYEVRYSEMDDSKRETEVMALLMTPEQERKNKILADIKEYEDWRFARMYEAQERARDAKKKAKEAAAKEKETMENTKVAKNESGDMVFTDLGGNRPIKDTKEAAEGLRSLMETLSPPLPERPMEDPKLPPPSTQAQTSLPEDVHVVFMTPEELEAETVDPFAVEKKPRK